LCRSQSFGQRAAFVDADQRQGFGHFFTGSSGILEREE
jgi:hypothetical protein